MKDGIVLTAHVASAALLAGAGLLVARVLGPGALVVRGVVAGLILGWAASAVELRLLLPHVRTDFRRAMRIVTAGFGLRLLAILIGMTLLDRTGLAGGNAFAMGVVAGFLAFLPVLAATLRGSPRNGGAA